MAVASSPWATLTPPHILQSVLLFPTVEHNDAPHSTHTDMTDGIIYFS